MAVEDKVALEGEVVESLPNLLFRIQLDMDDHEVLAHLAGKMRRNRIRVLPGDRVRVEVSPYDLTRGRIVYRMKLPPRTARRAVSAARDGPGGRFRIIPFRGRPPVPR